MAKEVKEVKKKKSAQGSALQVPLKVSAELQKVIGKKLCSRGETMKLVWEYIKENELQSKKDKRNIIPDKTLGKVIGDVKINMFQMTAKISKHLST